MQRTSSLDGLQPRSQSLSSPLALFGGDEWPWERGLVVVISLFRYRLSTTLSLETDYVFLCFADVTSLETTYWSSVRVSSWLI